MIDVRNWFLLNILRMDGQSSTNFFHPFLFILAGNDDVHESSKEFEILPDRTTDCGVSCPCYIMNMKLIQNI